MRKRKAPWFEGFGGWFVERTSSPGYSFKPRATALTAVVGFVK